MRKYDSKLWLYQSEADEPDYEFYLEKCDEGLFIERNYNYKEDRKTLNSIIESTFAKTEYELDNNNGLIAKISEPNGKITQYNYNSKDKVTNISINNKNINFEYNNQNLLSKVTQGNKKYIYTYNEFGKIKRVNIVDNIILINNTYDFNNGNLIKKEYGNNDTFSFEYDGFNRLSKITKTDDVYYIKYDANGNLAKIKSNNILKRYSYSLSQMLIEVKNKELKLKYLYDNCNNLITKNIYYENKMISILNNEYNKDNSIIKCQFDDNMVEYSYDKLGRIYEKKINNTYLTNYKYITNGKRSTTLLNYIKNGDDSYFYKYNKLNKITHIYHNNLLEQRYFYDQMNELVREDNFIDNLTTRYKYDTSGNITSKKCYKLNTYDLIKKNIYQYNNLQWEDQLTKFNNTEIVYDNIGNPLSLGTNIILNWKNGNELETYNDTINLIKYDYDEIGIRTSKIINGIKTTYYTEGKKVILEKTGNNVIYYLRDDVDNLIGFRYNNELYYYIKDLQDNIIGITDSSHNVKAKYRYDATGNVLAITDENGNDISSNTNHIANINPFRYRSYYYDKETGLYYLNTRYYNPLWARFLNADKYINANKDYLGHNLYVYASNDFINNIDEDGTSILSGITRKLWNFVAGVLKKKDMPVSSELLKHSAQTKPSDLHYGKNSIVAKAIEEDQAYQKQLDKAIKSADKNGNVEYKNTFAFTKTDLQGSFNNATITVTGTVIDDEVDLKVQIYDRYDFDLEIKSYGSGGIKWIIFTTGNNLAYLDQLTGAINNYNIYVDIDYKYCLVK